MNPEDEKGPPASEPNLRRTSEESHTGPDSASDCPPPGARVHSWMLAQANHWRNAVLRLLLAAASRLARLLRRPRWAVALVFALESTRLRVDSRRKP